jgi:hypothetical protein
MAEFSSAGHRRYRYSILMVLMGLFTLLSVIEQYPFNR